MTKITKCDNCGEIVNSDTTYGIDVYSIANKTHLKIDVCHTCFMENIFKKVPTEVVKWKQWNKEEKRFVDAK